MIGGKAHLIKLYNADVKTFTTINGGSNDKIGDLYAKDNKQVYYEEKIITNADPKTFRVLGDLYSVDKANIYYKTKALKGNSKDFRLIGDYYATDNELIYRQGELLVVKDVKSFKLLNDGWAKDKTAFYIDGNPVVGADYETFEILSSDYAKDKSKVYYISINTSEEIKDADAKTFKLTGKYNNIGKDKNSCYFFGKRTECK